MGVDLVGSTAVKQKQYLPLPDPEEKGDGYSQPWLSPIADFFSQFSRIFEECWEATKTAAPAARPSEVSDRELWKANGDELIYVKHIVDRRELFVCITSFLAAIKKYREELRKTARLNVKGTCWTAGFPISNVEVIFQRDVTKSVKQYADDARVHQFYLRELWHSNRDKSNLVRDFIGPSIDTGFRLTSLATPRKFPISIEVAWLLATAHLPPKSKRPGVDWFSIGYNGRKEIKVSWAESHIRFSGLIPRIKTRA